MHTFFSQPFKELVTLLLRTWDVGMSPMLDANRRDNSRAFCRPHTSGSCLVLPEEDAANRVRRPLPPATDQAEFAALLAPVSASGASSPSDTYTSSAPYRRWGERYGWVEDSGPR